MKRSGGSLRKLQESRRLVAMGGPVNEWEAGRLESQATAELLVNECDLVRSHGEIARADTDDLSDGHWNLVDTLQHPNMIAVDASEQRLERVRDAGVLEIAVDAVESVKADNSIEKMLVHQMALAHDAAMRLLPKALEQRDPGNMQKYINAAARLMDIYRQGVQVFHRIKAGGRQTVTVQHVHIGDGGQAIVGPVSTGGRGTREGRS